MAYRVVPGAATLARAPCARAPPSPASALVLTPLAVGWAQASRPRAAGRTVVTATAIPTRLHPDAANRRREAERRRRERQEVERTQTRRKTLRVTRNSPKRAWWEECSTAGNIVLAQSPAAYHDALAAGQRQGKLVVVSYFAPWCRGCKCMAPKIKQLAEQHPEALFIKFNTESADMRDEADKIGIDRLPMFHFHKDEELVASFSANLGTVDRIRQQLNYYCPQNV